MSRRRPQKPVPSRIILPSGRAIEVLRNDELLATPRELHVCGRCESTLVQPRDWRESADARWELTLHCPNCRFTETGTFTHAEVERLEERLDQGVADLIDDLQRLTRANMAADVDRFLSALGADLILPEDF